MVLESKEDAIKYLEEVQKHLGALRHLSQDAGLNTHAAIWLAISAAFMESNEEIDTISDMIGMYLEAKLKQIEDQWNTEL